MGNKRKLWKLTIKNTIETRKKVLIHGKKVFRLGGTMNNNIKLRDKKTGVYGKKVLVWVGRNWQVDEAI